MVETTTLSDPIAVNDFVLTGSSKTISVRNCTISEANLKTDSITKYTLKKIVDADGNDSCFVWTTMFNDKEYYVIVTSEGKLFGVSLKNADNAEDFIKLKNDYTFEDKWFTGNDNRYRYEESQNEETKMGEEKTELDGTAIQNNNNNYKEILSFFSGDMKDTAKEETKRENTSVLERIKNSVLGLFGTKGGSTKTKKAKKAVVVKPPLERAKHLRKKIKK